MIAEAWDLWGYEVGNFPSDWGEWNGRYRDAVRRFIRGDGNTREFADMINGDFFISMIAAVRNTRSTSSRLMTAFTLLDLASYNAKQQSTAMAIWTLRRRRHRKLVLGLRWGLNVRRQQLRNFWTILLLSRGVPMAVAGDELARTQNGNNNPWAIDSVGTWTNYRMVATASPTQLPTEGGGRYDDNFGTAFGRLLQKSPADLSFAP